MRLCLNMIVRNEAPIIERCLASVAPWIDAWAICDTGSTDCTQGIITRFFDAAGISGLLAEAPFRDFSQARNAGLDAAREAALSYDALLLADADMELVVEDPDFARALDGAACRLRQRAGVSYWNLRLLRRDAPARYVGATHEYLDVTGPVSNAAGAWFIDHACGSSRPDKIARDTALLEAAVAANPEDARSWFYLAQTHRDAGRSLDAAQAYARRARLGGWEEEAWHARWQAARCRLAAGETAVFIEGALAAYAARPHRAEPLYDLARYWRERGGHDAAMMFAEQGLAIPYPEGEQLFVDDAIYRTGLAEEAAISGYHASDPARRARGRLICDALALNRTVPAAVGALARHNAGWYAAREDWAAGETRAILPDGARIEGLSRAGDGVLALTRQADASSLLRLDAALSVVAGNALPSPQPADGLVEWRGEPVLVRPAATGALLLPLSPDGAAPAVATRAEPGATLLLGHAAPLALAAFEPWTVRTAAGATLLEMAPPWLMSGMTRGLAALAFHGGWLILADETEELGATPGLFSRLCWVDAEARPSRLSARARRIDALCWHPDGVHLVVAKGCGVQLIEAAFVAGQLGLSGNAAPALQPQTKLSLPLT